ncbi:MAG: ferritin-like domain-containing protein [Marmoricola sp.]
MRALAALQRVLAGEHAAVYVYGVLGGQVSASHQPSLFAQVEATYERHVHQRDRLTEMVRRSHGVPVAADPAYRMPNRAGTPDQVRAAARLVEQRCADLYGQLVESSTGADRAWAISALDGAALRVLHFGGAPTAFPGLSDRPTRPRRRARR